MKNLLIILLFIPVFAFSQTLEEFDFIASINEEVLAVKKGDSWGFLNNDGSIIIPFRNDLVLTEIDGYKYPVFKNNRCIISENKNGITYYGYIDKTGKTVIDTKFLNASNFSDNQAIALELIKETIGNNQALGKNVVNYKYFEVIIDIDGNVKAYLNSKGANIVLDKKFLSKPPQIDSKKISKNIYAIKTETMKWKIVVINN